MNALCISPGCSKEALSIDAGWVACEEHERSKAHDTPTEFDCKETHLEHIECPKLIRTRVAERSNIIPFRARKDG